MYEHTERKLSVCNCFPLHTTWCKNQHQREALANLLYNNTRHSRNSATGNIKKYNNYVFYSERRGNWNRHCYREWAKKSDVFKHPANSHWLPLPPWYLSVGITSRQRYHIHNYGLHTTHDSHSSVQLRIPKYTMHCIFRVGLCHLTQRYHMGFSKSGCNQIYSPTPCMICTILHYARRT